MGEDDCAVEDDPRLLDRAKQHLRAFELMSGVLLAAMGLLFITGHEALLMHPFASNPTTELALGSSAAAGPATCGAGIATSSPTAESAASAPPAPIEALASESRPKIVDRLSRGECSVGELTDLVGSDRTPISKYLAVLRAGRSKAIRPPTPTNHRRVIRYAFGTG